MQAKETDYAKEKRKSVIALGWTVDVIAHILGGIKNEM